MLSSTLFENPRNRKFCLSASTRKTRSCILNSDEDLEEARGAGVLDDDLCWSALFLWLYDGDHGKGLLCAEAFDVLVIAVSAHEISRSIASESDMS